MSVFKKFVELGRVVEITKGKDKAHQAVIVDIIDSNRLLVDGPGIHRQECKLADARLSKFKLNIHHNIKVKDLRQKWDEARIEFRYNRMPYADRLEKLKRRAAVTDYGHFTMRNAQQKRRNIIYSAYKTLKSREPRTLGRLERDRKTDMLVRLGYKKVTKLTPAEKQKKLEVKQARYKKLQTTNANKYKTLEAARAKRREARKAINTKKAAAGKLKPREKVPKEQRKTSSKNACKPRVNRALLRRQRVDQDLKKAKLHRQWKTQGLQKSKKAAA